jgi:hypothetical protein
MSKKTIGGLGGGSMLLGSALHLRKKKELFMAYVCTKKVIPHTTENGT